ncbi:hypothetical protein GCM10010182_39210 [Actinomadura cremea]|nr:hypothetical protein GCM10010182_39210 [Actinomadura cremea]
MVGAHPLQRTPQPGIGARQIDKSRKRHVRPLNRKDPEAGQPEDPESRVDPGAAYQGTRPADPSGFPPSRPAMIAERDTTVTKNAQIADSAHPDGYAAEL